MGLNRFMREAGAKVMDEDEDAGGPRCLLRIDLPDDEPLVYVSFICPSTQRRRILRVPPDTATCRRAIAWTASVDNPNNYQPMIET